MLNSNRYATRTILAVIGVCFILSGCGQRGPLSLPKPEFPAPSQEPKR